MQDHRRRQTGRGASRQSKPVSHGAALTTAILRDDHVLLLRAALLEGDAACDAFARWRRTVAFDDVDGNAFRILPLLYRNLVAARCNDSLMGRLKGIWRRTWFQNQLRIEACRPAIEALARAGIPVLLLKGAAMVARWVDDVGTRPMADFDILVPRDRARDAIARLVDAGWAPHQWRADLFDDADFDSWHGTALRRNEFEIDLHWRALRDGSANSSNESLWARSQPARLAGQTIRVPAPEDHLVHACVHGAGWAAGGRIDWASDAALILRGAGPSFDWSRVVAAAKSQRLMASLEALLGTLSASLGIAIPPLPEAGPAGKSTLVERVEFGLRRRPPHEVGPLGRILLDLQDFRRRNPHWLDRSITSALPAFGRECWQLDKEDRIVAYAAFAAIGGPAILRRTLVGNIRSRLLARRDLPDLGADVIDLTDHASIRGGLVHGWSVPESAGGRWTVGGEAEIALRAEDHRGDLTGSMRLRPFARPLRRAISAQVWANDHRIATWLFSPGDGSAQFRSFVVPRYVIARQRSLRLGLRIRRAASPASLGLSDDTRRLGLFVEEIRLAPATLVDAMTRPLSFAAGSPDAVALWDGWSVPEGDGCWSNRPRAELRFRLRDPPRGDVQVAIYGRVYLPLRSRQRLMVVRSGSAVVGRFAVSNFAGAWPLRVTLPAQAVASGEIAITLDIADAVAPVSLGESADPRPIGFFLQQIAILPTIDAVQGFPTDRLTA